MDLGLEFEDDGLRMLSIDAGDMRTLSQVIILGEFMSRLRWIKKVDDDLPPCRYFNMIIGVGLGGIIAILFGVFEMTVVQASSEFTTIYEEVFTDTSLSRAERSQRLKELIESLLQRHDMALDTRLLRENTSKPGTRTIVCATPSVDMKFCRLFRNFNSQHVSDNPTIVEAIMATCSTLDLFEPVSIGLERRKEDFISGSYSAANPINELIKEAHEIFGPERTVSYIMSLGAGGTPFISLVDHPSTIDAKVLEAVATNVEKTAEEIERRLGRLNVYFRFTVNRGLDAAQSNDRFGFIESCTKSYLQSAGVDDKMDRALRFLSEPGRIQIDRIYRTKQTNPKSIPGLPPLSAFFVPRPAPMNMLLTNLSEDGTRKQKKVVVSGMGGCGKSQLVSCFARTYGHDYQHILFIDASSAETTRNTLIQRVRTLGHGFNIKTVEEALDLLSQLSDDSWLIIFDNADSTNFELSQFIPDCDHGSFIITTRNPSLGLLSPNSHLTLDVMSPPEAIDVLLSCVMKSGALPSESDRKHAAEIVEELGYLPVAIVQAGCFIRLQDCMDTYLERYQKSRRVLLHRPAKAQLDNHHHSVYIALDVTVPYLSPRAVQLSSLLGFFHYTGIPLPLFERVAKRSFTLQPFDLLDVSPFFQETVSLLQGIISPYGEWDEEEFRFTLEELQNYSLVTLVNVGAIKTVRYHTLVRAWAQDRLTLPEQAKFKAAAARMLSCGMSNEDEDLFEYLTVHIDSLSSDWDQLHVNDRAAFANVFYSDGDIDTALRMWTQIHTEVEKAHGENHLRTSEASLRLAECYCATGKSECAVSLAKKAMEYRISTLGKDDLETLRAVACHARLQPYMEAKPLQTHILDVREKVLHPNHTEIAQAKEDLANTLSKKFQSINTACQLMNEAIIIRTTTQGEDHRATLRAKERLASINERGWLDTAGASRLLENVVATRKRDLGLDHRETQRSMIQLARSYEQQSRYAPAAELWVDLLNLRRKDPHGEYEECTKAIERIAERRATGGSHAEAERLHRILFELYKELHGIEHEVTISIMEHISRQLEAQNKLCDADLLRESILTAQRQVYGETSSQVLSTMEKLASSYEQQRQFEQAVSFRMELVSLKSEGYGPDQPETTAAVLALNAAFNSLDTQSQYDDAIRSWRSQVTALSYAQETAQDRLEWINTLADIAWEFRTYGIYQTASSTPRDARRLWDDLLAEVPTMPYQTVCAMEALAEIFLRNSQRERSEALLEDALVTRVKLFGETADSTMTATETLIKVYRSLPPVGEIPSTPSNVKERQLRIRNCVLNLWQRKRKLLGPAHADTMDTLKRLASACEEHSHLNDAERHLKEIISVYREIEGETDELTLDAWDKLVLFHFSHGLFDQGIVVSKEIVDVKRRQFGENHSETLFELEKLLLRCEANNMWDQRASILRDSLEIRCSLAESGADGGSGGLDERILADMEKLANWHASRKKYEEAIPLARRVLDARYQMLPHNHPDVLTSAKALAAIYTLRVDSGPDNPVSSIESNGYLELADSVLRRLIEVRQKEFGQYSESVTLACGAYMQLLVQGLRFDELERFTEELLMEVERTYDSLILNSRGRPSCAGSSNSNFDTNPNLITTFNANTNAITSPTITSMPTSSDTSYAPTINSDFDPNDDRNILNTPNVDSPTILFPDFDLEKRKPLVTLRTILSFIGQIGTQPCVQRLLKRIVEVSKKGLGSEHEFTMATMKGLSSIYMDKQMYPEAQTLLEEVLGVLDKLNNSRNDDVLRVLEPLALTYRLCGQYEKAEDVLRRAKAIDISTFAGDSEASLRNQASIARLRIDQGRWGQAEPILLDLILKRDFLTPDTHRLAKGDLMLVYEHLGKIEKAQALARDFLDFFQGPERATPCPPANVALTYAACGRHEDAMRVLEHFLEQSHHSTLNEQIARQTLLGIYIGTANVEKARNYCTKIIDSKLAPPIFIRDAFLKAIFKKSGISNSKPEPVVKNSIQDVEYEPKTSLLLGSERLPSMSAGLDKGKGPISQSDQQRHNSSAISDIGSTLENSLEDEDNDDLYSIADLEETASILEAKGEYEVAQALRIKLVMAKFRVAFMDFDTFEFEKSNIYLEDLQVLGSMEDLAKNYEKQDKHESARHVWESILYLCSLGYEDDEKNPYMIRAMDCLAESYEDLKLYDKAEGLREQLLEVLESGADRDADRVCEEMERIAALCVQQERLEDAESWSIKVLKARKQAHVDWLAQQVQKMRNRSSAYGTSGTVRGEEWDEEDAVDESYGDLLKANITKALDALEWLAWKMDERAEHSKSEGIWKIVLETRKEFLGEDDLITQETANLLAENLELQGRDGEAGEIRKKFNIGIRL